MEKRTVTTDVCMMNKYYYPPVYGHYNFHCPHCTVYAKQRWSNLNAQHVWGGDEILKNGHTFNEKLNQNWHISKCEHCGGFIIWLGEKIIFPESISVDKPNNDLQEDIQVDYLEAAKILNKSPRGASALLRLALQKLLIQLGEKGININEDISALVKKGLNPTIQKGLDFVRVTGNNAVHPGQIDLKDNLEIAKKLFQVINFIAEKMITEPNEVESLFNGLPESSKEAIKKRDKR